jgi:putative membrane protein
MREGLNELKTGVEDTEDARSTFSAGKDQMYQYADKSLEDISLLNMQCKDMIPYFQMEKNMLNELNTDIGNINTSLKELEDPLEDMDVIKIEGDLELLQEMLEKLNKQLSSMLTDMGKVVAAGSATPYEAAELQGRVKLATTLGQYSKTINSLLEHSDDMAESTQEIINISEDLVGLAGELDNTLTDYNDDLNNMLDDCQTLTVLLNTSIDSSLTFLTYSKSLIQVSADKLNNATEISLKGMNDVLEKSILGLDSVNTLRIANDTIKTTIDDEKDKFENKNKFLNLDPKASPISFTSYKNPTPSSIQIILRTAEISVDSGNTSKMDMEPEKRILDLLAE